MTGARGKTTLLLLYAEPERAGSLVRLLSRDEAHVVISCPLTAPVDRWLDDLQPDLILLDPPTDRQQLEEACQHLRAQTARPIVVLSEFDDELLISRVLAAGIDDYLVLPIGERELAARIDALLRRTKGNGALHETAFGGLSLSSLDLSADWNGRKIFLSPIEFRLLSCLAAAAGKVVTHDALMSRAWGAEYVDCRHYLHLYIRYLREKLEEDPRRPHVIVSEWGVGYRFVSTKTS